MNKDIAKHRYDLEEEVEYLDDDEELELLSHIFLRTPWEYGFDGPVGKKYEALKDFLSWYELDEKEWVPVVLSMASIWINASKKDN